MVLTTATTGSTRAFKTIAYATNHTLTLGTDTDEVNTKDDNDLYKNKEVTGQNWSATTENLIAADPNDEGAPTYDALMKALRGHQKVEIHFASLPGSMGVERKGDNWTDSANTPEISNWLYGYAYITDLQLNANVKENVTYTATFTGCGALTLLKTLAAANSAKETKEVEA